MTVNGIPNLFLIGAPKSGTSALASALSQHPEVFVDRKEPRYFDARTYYDDPEDAVVTSLDQYLSLYHLADPAKYRYILDASVFNMYSEDSIQEILSLSSNAKFILVLRDPLEASKSMHVQRLKYPAGPLREVSDSFSECWKTLELRKNGLGYPENCKNRFLFRYDLMFRYELYLPFLVKLIPAQNLLCLDYAVFKRDSERVHRAIFSFLGLDAVDIANLSVDPSYIVPEKPGIFDFLRSVALPIAKRFPSLKRFFSIVARYIPQRKLKKKPDHESVDQEVRDYFQDTYRAMDLICAKYEVNKC